MALFGGVAALCTGWLVLWLFSIANISIDLVKKARLPVVLLSVLHLVIVLQLVPLPLGLVELLSPQAAVACRLANSTCRISLDVAATQEYLLRSLCYFGAFCLALVLINSRKRLEWVLWTLFLSGVFQAIYGSLMVISGAELGFFVEKYTGKGTATGTFVNRNHLAGYLVLCLSAGTGLLVSSMERRRFTTLRDELRHWLSILLSSKVVLRFGLALMVIALVLTRSRMGNVAFFVALAVAGFVAMWRSKQVSLPLVVLLVSLFVVDAVIVGQWFGFDEVVERLEKTAIAEEQRVEVSGSGSALVENFWLTGAGGGSFYGVFHNYLTSDVQSYYDHAHNDYLEITADLGVPVLLMFAGLVVAGAWRVRKLLSNDMPRLQRGVGFALCMTLVWLSLHSAVDFNLHIPAVAYSLSVMMALLWCSLERPALGH